MNFREFSKSYDKIYNNDLQNSTWPWSDLVSKVMYIKNELPRRFTVLELGCGQGANIDFFKGLNANYYGIDASINSISILQNKYPDLRNNLFCGNFIEKFSLNKKIDLIIDRASLTCNSTNDIKKCLQWIKNILKAHSFFIGVDWYSTKHDEFKKGLTQKNDSFFKSYPENSFFQPPQMHFSNAEHLKNLFYEYDLLHMEEKTTKHFIKYKDLPTVISSWNFIAKYGGSRNKAQK